MEHQLQFLTVLNARGIAKCSKGSIHLAIDIGRLDGYTLKLGARAVFLFKEKDVRAFSKAIQTQNLALPT